jgi:hypothetical protein
MRTIGKLLSISLLVGVMACGDDDGDDGSDGSDDSADDGTDDGADDGVDAGGACKVAAWAAPDFEANAATALALRAQLDALAGGEGLMRGAEQELKGSEVDDVAALTAVYEGGDPSFAGSVTERYDAIMDDAFADFVALVAASAQDLINDDGVWTPGEAGGLAGSSPRGINAGGLEIRQIADKGLFGGAGMYAYALTLTEGEITPATIDALAAAWGSNDALGTGEDELTDSANYSFGMGFHAEMAAALAAARSYADDEACATQRDEAIVTFFRAWEQSLVARTIYYANAAAALIAGAAKGPAGDEDKIDALHELSEGIGLAFGFLGLPDPAAGPLSGAGRLLGDEDVEAMMIALGVDISDLSASTTGTFVELAALLLTGVAAFEATAIEVFGLSADDIAAYRTPTEG